MKDEIMSRRVMLRKALAVGCGLCLPVALFGCDSKKGTNSTGAAPTGTAPASGEGAKAPAAASKMPQASAKYQAQPKGVQKCSECLHFVAESNTCTLVDGQISPEGWCLMWTKKA
ncbi:MAG: high-potential iron-sulfur protein [Rhodocyclaceae bacterium]|jgi:hypothetical protein|nr:high-potential iron-sulfur protein [Rhodocyclaceae bacterium]